MSNYRSQTCVIIKAKINKIKMLSISSTARMNSLNSNQINNSRDHNNQLELRNLQI